MNANTLLVMLRYSDLSISPLLKFSEGFVPLFTDLSVTEALEPALVLIKSWVTS
jgi:hypothetical protein